MNSMLNPEAPEFYPHITSFTQGAYTSIHKSIRTSNAFPSGASYDFFKTFTDFNIVTCQLSENVVVQSNEIVITEMPNVKLKHNDMGYNTEIIVESNDHVLDRIEINMDTLNNTNSVSEAFLYGVKPGSYGSPWNNNLVIAKIQVGSTMFIGAKNIPRPQLNFKDPVDNSDSLWVPKISDKPNNIKPLALNIIYNDKGEAVGYEHPYNVELDLYEPPAEFLEPGPMPPSYPPPMEQTRFTFIETEAQVDQLVEHLNTVKELAVDVEHHSYRTYQGITCLIQISTDEGGDFIIDTLAVREHIHKLNLSFTDPRKVKVFHGAEHDVLWLQRDFGVYIVGLFDTYQAAKALLLSGLSLKHLLWKYCQVDADKQYQLADWRMRPLPDELLHYARQDTHYLLYVWRRMRAELLALAGGDPARLRAVFHNSKIICGATYNKLVVDETSHLPLYVRYKRQFDSRQMAALKMLYKWRDAQARLLDESTAYLLPNHMLLALAGTLPREVQGVSACCSPTPPFVKQNLITIHRMLLSCRELPLEPVAPVAAAPAPAAPAAPRASPASANVGYDVHDLDHFPKLMKKPNVRVKKSTRFVNEINKNDRPTLSAITPVEEKKVKYVSNLNVDAQMYIPPYYRYRGYRILAKEEEIKEIEKQEAKITAIAQGDQLIKAEVLQKLQESKNLIQNEGGQLNNWSIKTQDFEPISQKKAIRKRKMSAEKAEKMDKNEKNAPKAIVKENKTTNKDGNKLKAKSEVHNVKPFNYKHVNYKKFHEEGEQTRKHPKMKLKKHK